MSIKAYLFGFLLIASLACAFSASGQGLSLADALDNHTFSWSSGADLPWFAETIISHDGANAAESGALADNQASMLQAAVTGPLTVSFCWKVSSQQDADFLGFYVDDTQAVSISGEVDWSRYTTAVPEGPHILKWVYSKDGSDLGGNDRGWLDQVSIDNRACVDARNTSGVMDGTSWAFAFTTIQAGIDAMAAALAPATAGSGPFAPEVWVAEGTYTTSTGPQVVLMRAGVDLYGGFAGSEASRAQRNAAAHVTVIYGWGWRCIVGADATIDGFRVEGGGLW